MLSSAALDVELSDDSFPPEDFGIVSGMLNVKWDRIAPYPLFLGNEGWDGALFQTVGVWLFFLPSVDKMTQEDRSQLCEHALCGL